MNLLLDTNILIDYLGRREPFFAQAERIVAAGFFGDATLWMAAQSPKDAFYVLERYASSQHIQQALLETYRIITSVALTADDLTRVCSGTTTRTVSLPSRPRKPGRTTSSRATPRASTALWCPPSRPPHGSTSWKTRASSTAP